MGPDPTRARSDIVDTPLLGAENGERDIVSITQPQPGELQVTHRVEGQAVIVHAVGEVDVHTAPDLTEHLAVAIKTATPPGPVVVDLRKIEFFGSRGVGVLLLAQQECDRHGTALRILATRRVIRPLDITGARADLTLCSTLTEALHSDSLTS